MSTTPSSFSPKDQRRLEAPPDVLTYTDAALGRDVEVIGYEILK